MGLSYFFHFFTIMWKSLIISIITFKFTFMITGIKSNILRYMFWLHLVHCSLVTKTFSGSILKWKWQKNIWSNYFILDKVDHYYDSHLGVTFPSYNIMRAQVHLPFTRTIGVVTTNSSFKVNLEEWHGMSRHAFEYIITHRLLVIHRGCWDWIGNIKVRTVYYKDKTHT